MGTFDFSGRTAFVTGASGGLGEAFARALAARGVHLLLNARRGDRLEALALEVGKKHGIRTDVVAADLGTEAGLRAVVAAVDACAPSLAVLNAGAGIHGPFAERDLTAHVATLRLNAEATVTLAHAALRPMLARGEGGLLIVASTASFQPAPLYAVYGATKAFLRSFGGALAAEVRPRGVTVTVTCPGPIATDFHRHAGLDGMPAALAPLLLPPAEVAERSLAAWQRGTALYVPGRANQLTRAMAALTPDPVAASLASRMLTAPKPRG